MKTKLLIASLIALCGCCCVRVPPGSTIIIKPPDSGTNAPPVVGVQTIPIAKQIVLREIFCRLAYELFQQVTPPSLRQSWEEARDAQDRYAEEWYAKRER